MTSGTDLAAADVLARARRHRAEADRAEAGVMEDALAWAELHAVTDPDIAATYGRTPVLLAGEGAPMTDDFAVVEFATTLGLTRTAGEFLVGHALELAYRLPRVWARVQKGSLQAWRARRIADETIVLSVQAADYVDEQIAKFAHRIGPVATQRLVETSIAQFMPDLARERAAAAARSRFVHLSHPRQGMCGVSTVWGELDTADALALDTALSAGAEVLKSQGSVESLDVRRSLALGNLARGENPWVQTALTLYLHLNAGDQVATLENGGPILVTADQVKEWCGSATKVTIKPVLDLAEEITSSGYAPSERLTEQVILRDRTCVFAYCNRSARHSDKDHIEPHDADGPPDQTSTGNLGSACRFHHRLKTHGNWTYKRIGPDSYLWTSPHGYQYLRDRHGTTDLNAKPVKPPGPEPG